MNKFEEALAIVSKFNASSLSQYDNKRLQVYSELIKLYKKEAAEILSENEEEKDYTEIIFEILEIFLVNQRFDEFEVALNMLNLISDKAVLLMLGKLYFKYGYKDMARKEIVRSIKEFEVFDSEGLEILR
jgi:hypothetical protein